MTPQPPSSPPASPIPSLSRGQHKAALWADPSLRVYAVVMADRWPAVAGPTLPGVPEHDCLRPGALEPEAARVAPWLLRLDRESPTTDWLLFDAAAELGEWGVLVLATLPFVPMRNRLRGFGEARLPDGGVVPLAWMDPTLLRALLPLADGAQLAVWFGGGVVAIGLAEPGRLVQYRAPLGGLVIAAQGVAG